MKALYAELNKRAEAATYSYSATDNLFITIYNIFILYLWLRIIRGFNQGVQFMNFPSQIIFNTTTDDSSGAAILKKYSLRLFPFYMAVAAYCQYEKIHKRICCSIVSYLLMTFYVLRFVSLFTIAKQNHNLYC